MVRLSFRSRMAWIGRLWALRPRGASTISLVLIVLGTLAWKVLKFLPFRLQPMVPFRVRLPDFDGFVHLMSDEMSVYLPVVVDSIYETTLGLEIQPGWVVIEGGAHVGFYTISRGSRLDSDQGGRFLALEPNPTALRLLQRNVISAGLAGTVHVIDRALYSAVGHVEFVSSRVSQSAHISAHGNVQTEGRTFHDRVDSVPSTTLDALVEEFDLHRIDLLKLNVEGAEHEAFLGGLHRALPITKRIVLSYETDTPLEEIEGVLAEFHLVPTRSRDRLYLFEREDAGRSTPDARSTSGLQRASGTT